MSAPLYGLVKCPACKKYFETVIGHIETDVEDNGTTAQAWEKGERECPVCKAVLNQKQWKENLVENPDNIFIKAVLFMQGGLKKGKVIEKQ